MNILIVDDDELYAHMLTQKLLELEPAFTVKAVATAAVARETVAATQTPFDVFLLDLRLDGSDGDGIALMQELFQRSPDSDAIILTGYDDLDSGLRAFDAGAYRYLTKPFDTRELVSILKVLEKTQGSRRESNWLRVLSEIAVTAQQGDTVQKVGEILCQEAQRLGFERARLWLRVDRHAADAALTEDTMFEGVSECGHAELPGFHGLRLSLRNLPYSQKVYASGRPGFFSGRPEPSGLDRYYEDAFKPPVGEWAKLPLIVDQRCIGFLVLDNADHPKSLTPEQRRLLGLFGNQAAAALERAIEQEETYRLLEIGRESTEQAAGSRLDDLLDTVRKQVGRVMGVDNFDNFIVVLLDEDAQQLDFRWHYERDKLQPRHWRPYPSCISGDVIQKNQTLLLPNGGDEYRKKRGMVECGDPSKCWLGVPLRLNRKAIGAIIIQSYEKENVYGSREERLLLAVADMAAGAIGLSYQAERNIQIHTFDESHILLRNKLRQLAKENEYWLWHAVLTLVTHRDGLSFNRAVLFWFDEAGAKLQGRMGIGYFTCQETRKAWERDEEEEWRIRDYLSQPQLGRSRPTRLQEEIAELQQEINGASNWLYQLQNQAQWPILSSNELKGKLPEKLLNPPDLPEGAKSFKCGLVPVKSGERELGVLVVDNLVDGKPVRPSDLRRLRELLEETVQVWQSVIEAKQLADVQSLGQQIMGQVTQRPLKVSLDELCERAKEITKANYVIIYPYLANIDRYDAEMVSYSSGPRDPNTKITNGPSQQGMTSSILRSGTLVVPDVIESELLFGGRRLADHDFVKREDVKAFIGAPMRSATGEPVGVVYLDYRTPQLFTEQDVMRAEQIANIGADAILFMRSIEKETHDRTEAEARERLRQRAMQFFDNIQTFALSPASSEESVIRSILQNTAELYQDLEEVILAVMKWDGRTENTYQTREDYTLDPTGNLKVKPINNIHYGKLGEVLRRAEEGQAKEPTNLQQVYVRGDKLITPILLGSRPIGAILVRRRLKQREFTVAEQEILEQLATVAALAIDSVQARARLQAMADTVSDISNSDRLEDALERVIAETRKYAPELDCVTVWYRDPDLEHRLVPGPQWGVHADKERKKDASEESLVRAMLLLTAPLYINDVEDMKEEDPLKNSDFITDQQIRSIAVFPLRSGQQSEALGVLFLNYRKLHKFTDPEGAFFMMFANAVANAIQNALVRRREALLTATLNVIDAVGSESDPDRLLRNILFTLRKHFNKQQHVEVQPYVMLYDKDDDALYLPAVARDFMPVDNPAYKDELRLHLDGRDGGIVCRVARTAMELGNVHVVNFRDIRKDKDYLNFYNNSVSLLCAGLVQKEGVAQQSRLRGILAVSSPVEAAFGDLDELLLLLAAQQVVIAMVLVEQAKELVKQAGQMVSSRRKQTVMAWQSEIVHTMKSVPFVIGGVVEWFEMTQVAIPGADRCVQLLTKLSNELSKMLNTNVPTLELFDFHEFIDELTMWMVDTDKFEKVFLQCELHRQDLALYCDRNLLRRSLQNLINNAAEAMKFDGTIMLITHEDVESGTMEIEVRDSGPGFPRESRSKIGCEPWSPSGDPKRGNGLFNTSLFMEMIDGSMELLPDLPNIGARLMLRIPAKQQGT